MKIKISSDRIYNAETDNLNSTAVNCKQQLDFLNEKNKIIQFDDQMEETSDRNVSQKKLILKTDQELKKMMSKLKRLNVVDLTTKDKIADLFQKMQRIVQYLDQHNPHNDY